MGRKKLNPEQRKINQAASNKRSRLRIQAQYKETKYDHSEEGHGDAGMCEHSWGPSCFTLIRAGEIRNFAYDDYDPAYEWRPPHIGGGAGNLTRLNFGPRGDFDRGHYHDWGYIIRMPQRTWHWLE